MPTHRRHSPPLPTGPGGRPTPVRVWTEALSLPTYLPAKPDRNPMFLENRVYQGSSGRVYPLPFTDRIAETRTDRAWQAVWLENEYLRVLILPELGGRIHALEDKTNGYDLIYRQHVIKPALVGLAGPWISGGIEFNWPQHHRPATFLPVRHHVETEPDGSVTVWLGDHDPMARMKGAHGVCLHPGKAFLELKVRVHNRTPFTQTFLWWANVATRVHEGYQSFFPPDVRYVADHAKRALSEYPFCQGRYYGVDYAARARQGVPIGERPTQSIPPHCQPSPPSGHGVSQPAPGLPGYAPNDLRWYANIPTPCSYMALGSREDFFGGYDHYRQAGLVHIASHHIAPGKKQWTWGNHDFGYAWDRNLTDTDGPYIELMAGVYTDNQPDFSFLQPGETKSWSQYWYPIQKIGVPQAASLHAAASILPAGNRRHRSVHIGVAVTANHTRARITLRTQTNLVWRRTRDLQPGRPFLAEVRLRPPVAPEDLTLSVSSADGRDLLTCRPAGSAPSPPPAPATEPPPPQAAASTDELFFIGLHLDQYRHATRHPTDYWREALRRDPLDARCNNALGRWHLLRGEFAPAETHFRQAIARLTQRNPNPPDGEPFYHLGLCLRFQADRLPRTAAASAKRHALLTAACDAFHKATWNQAWAPPAYLALAELDCRQSHWASALDHLDRTLRLDTHNLIARNLKVLVLRTLNRPAQAGALLAENLQLDPLDAWARHLAGTPPSPDLQTSLDVAHDCARAGFVQLAIALLETALAAHNPATDLPTPSWGAIPLVHYTLACFQDQIGHRRLAQTHRRLAQVASPDYCFPARLEEIAVLQAAMDANPQDARAPYYLGNLLYDRRRHDEAIQLWERSTRLDPRHSVAWRNLGLGYFNQRQQPAKALAAYARARAAAPGDARLLFEYDQLRKRIGHAPALRLRTLEQHLDLVRQRDDLSVELATLYNQTEQPRRALTLIASRKFQPWEGGEGLALGQHVRTHLALGRLALQQRQPAVARRHFELALTSPPNLGEARHLLANQSDVHYWLGLACEAGGDLPEARRQWRIAATFRGDFQDMRAQPFSEMTYYSALAWQRLGQKTRARQLLRQLLDYAERLQHAPAQIDYFATSLPTLLLFRDDLQMRQTTTAMFLQAQARLGLRQSQAANRLLRAVLRRDPNHPFAADLLAR